MNQQKLPRDTSVRLIGRLGHGNDLTQREEGRDGGREGKGGRERGREGWEVVRRKKLRER